MATPDFDHRSNEVEWSIQPQYTAADNDGRMICGMTGFAKRKDEVVYRGVHIDDFLGFFAIGQDSAEQLARLIGFVDPEIISDTVQQAAEALDRVAELEQLLLEQDQLLSAYEVILVSPEDAEA